MNIQGLGAIRKKKLVHRLVSTHNVDVICLLEKIVASGVLIDILKGVLKSWDFVALDSEGGSEPNNRLEQEI